MYLIQPKCTQLPFFEFKSAIEFAKITEITGND